MAQPPAATEAIKGCSPEPAAARRRGLEEAVLQIQFLPDSIIISWDLKPLAI